VSWNIYPCRPGSRSPVVILAFYMNQKASRVRLYGSPSFLSPSSPRHQLDSYPSPNASSVRRYHPSRLGKSLANPQDTSSTNLHNRRGNRICSSWSVTDDCSASMCDQGQVIGAKLAYDNVRQFLPRLVEEVAHFRREFS
jgi:hypothetical protein